MSSSVVMPLPEEQSPQRLRWMFHVVMLSVAVSVIGLSFLLSVKGPHEVVVPWVMVPLPETCGMQRSMGIDCPGCGLTRSFISLAHGNLAASLAFNPGGILVFALIAFQIPYRLAQLARVWTGRPAWNLMYVALWIWSLIGVVLFTQWIVKMFL